MSSIQDHEKFYRRGLVLGLTMAEITIMVIFVLLLVLGALFAQKNRKVKALRQQITTFKAAIPEIARLREIKEKAESAQPQGTTKLSLPKFFRELVLLRSAVVDANVTATPEALRQALAEGAAAKEALAGKGSAVLAKDNARLARENKNLKAQMAYLRHHAQSGGRGRDYPPCWATPDGKPEYIFDVVLTSRGLILRDRHLPHRAADYRALPLADFAFGNVLKGTRFLTMTEPLFRWSIDHKCRFYVRAFDTTRPTEKAIYKQKMRELEQRFYKYEVLNKRF